MLNSNKTQFIFIATRQLLSNVPDDMTINFDGNVIPISKHVKILSVYFDKYMTFDTHTPTQQKSNRDYNVHKQS